MNAIPTWILANLSESDKWQKQIRDIVESAYDHGADMIVTPCQLCQANVEVYQSEINKKQDTKFALPVIYYSQLLSVVYGASVEQSGLDGHVTQPKKLQDIAGINDGAIIHTLGTVT
ncbi:MAG: hypothetical protein WC053_01770 [Sideroxydans sp.]